MNNLFTVFLNSLISLVFCMAVGYFCRKVGLLDDRLNAGLRTLLVKITLPCTVFMSLMRPFSFTLLWESIAAFFLSAAVYLFGGCLGAALAWLLKVGSREKNVWIFSLIFANVGYMGFPVSQAVFGDEGMIYTSMANAAFNLLAFTLGIKLFNGGNQTRFDAPEDDNPSASASEPVWRMILLNPALLATMVGFIFFVSGLRLPTPIANGVSMIGAMTSPVSMLLVGSILAKSALRSLFADGRTLPVIALRLVIIPLAAFAVLRLFVTNSVMLGVVVTLSAMPVASLTAIFAEQYRGDTALASKLVALSMLLCVVTMPLISLLFV